MGSRILTSVRIWAWFSRKGAGKIYQIDKYSPEEFDDVLGEELVPSLVTRYGVGPMGFVRNTHSPNLLAFFTSISNPRNVRYWFRGCYEILWPHKSEELHPFSTIWTRMEEAIRLQRNQPRTAKELFKLIEMLWEAIARQPLYWSGLIECLKHNMKKIILVKGERVSCNIE